MRQVCNAAGGLGGNTLLKKGPVKAVAVSLARATTNNTDLTVKLFRNMDEAYSEAVNKGGLNEPSGFDPEVKFAKIEAFTAYKKHRSCGAQNMLCSGPVP